jgi:glycosyltransferase involved in cell wall biosynthesis
MSDYPTAGRLESVSVILPVIDEADALRRTAEIVRRQAGDALRELLIVTCGRTTPEALAEAARIQREGGDSIVVHRQKLPYLGGALREAFELARGSHVLMMSSDLETDPGLVGALIARARSRPAEIVAASRWLEGGGFHGYSKAKLACNWLFQRFFSRLYGCGLTDMTYAYRLYPAGLMRSIRWEELRHPFLFESLVKPLRLGVRVSEIPAIWRARESGRSSNTFLGNFSYIRVGFAARFAAPRSILK